MAFPLILPGNGVPPGADPVQLQASPLSTTMLAPVSAPALPGISAPSLMPTAQPNQVLTDQDKLGALRSSGSGISQIHNPFLRGLAETGDVVGSILAPRIEQSIPGTNLHHQLLVNQAQNNLANDQATQFKQAQIQQQNALTQQEEAKADALTDPTKAVDPSKTVTTDDGVYQLNPATGKYDVRVGDPHEKPVPPHYVSTADGNVVAITTGSDGVPKASTVYEGTPKQQTEVTKLEVDGKPHTVIVDKNTGATVKDLGETGEKPPSVSVSTGTFSLASVPDGNGGYKSVLLNNKSGEVKDAPTGLTKQTPATSGAPTTADRNRSSLATIAKNNLDHIQDVVQRRQDLFGPGPGRITSVDQLIGSNDPDLIALVNEAHNFAMANAGIHGSRSVENVRDTVKDLFNDFKSGPQGIMGGVKANQDNLDAIINPKGGAEPPRPANVPAGYSFNAHGPKGAGWYAPAAK